MNLKKAYYDRQNNFLRIIALALLLLPFHSLTAILMFIYVAFRVWRMNYQQIIQDKLTKGLILLTIFLSISSFLAYNIGEAWVGMPLFLPFFWLFVTYRTIITKYQHLFFLVIPIVINSFLVMFYGIAELNFGWVSSDLLYALFGWQLTGGGDPVGRIASVFPYANLVALYFVIVIIFSLALLIENRKYQKQGKIQLGKIDYFLMFTVILNLVGLALTSSRNAWIICFLSFMAFAIYLSWYWIIQLFTIAGLAVIGASFGNFPGQSILRKIVPDFIWLRFSDQAYPDRPIPTLRITQWNFCLDLIKERPFWGWGLRNFTVLYEEKMGIYLGHPHNFFLMLGAETGIINLLIFLIIVGSVLSQGLIMAIKLKKSQQEVILFVSLLMVMGCYIVFNLLDVNLFDFRLNVIAWIILAAISGITKDEGQSDVATKEKPSYNCGK